MSRYRSKTRRNSAFAYLAPRPDLVVGTLADLGLSDDTIGRYFGVDAQDIAAIPHVAPPVALDASDVMCFSAELAPVRHSDAA